MDGQIAFFLYNIVRVTGVQPQHFSESVEGIQGVLFLMLLVVILDHIPVVIIVKDFCHDILHDLFKIYLNLKERE